MDESTLCSAPPERLAVLIPGYRGYQPRQRRAADRPLRETSPAGSSSSAWLGWRPSRRA
ncbi:MAG: hypothetical protein WKF75_06330 [Singulisphaera sp.]